MRSRSRDAGACRIAATALVAMTAGIALALAGCGSMTATGTAGGPAASFGGSPAGTRAAAVCQASALRVSLAISAAGAAAGSSFVPLDFTNISRGTCRLAGYPAVSLASGQEGRQVGTAAAVDRAVRARPVLLEPGATAHAWLQVTDALDFPAGKCHPVTAAGLRVTLPGQRGASYLRHSFPACAAAPHGSGILMIQPIQPGAARRGTAQ